MTRADAIDEPPRKYQQVLIASSRFHSAPIIDSLVAK